MTSPEAAVLRQRITRVILLHAVDTTGASVAEAARLAQADLAAVFAPLISSSGVEALLGRAFDLAQREYPVEERRGDSCPPIESIAQVSRWLERQASSVATDAAAAMFAIFAELLAALIGEPLTTRYLEKAWPDGFSDAEPKRKKT
jgi:hypothetical protein